jgi:hypothetical protein
MRSEDQVDRLSQPAVSARLPLPESTLREKVERPKLEQVYFSIPELASRWRCSRGTVYNRLRLSGVKVLDFGFAGRKSKKLVPAAVVLHMEAKHTKVLP